MEMFTTRKKKKERKKKEEEKNRKGEKTHYTLFRLICVTKIYLATEIENETKDAASCCIEATV